MKRVAFFCLTLTIILIWALPPTMAAPIYRWKLTNIQPAGMIYTKYFNLLAEKITEATNGEVEVTNYPAGELPYKATDLLKVCGKGLVDMAEVVGVFVGGEAPMLTLLDFAYLALNEKELKILRQTVTPYIAEELRERGVEPLAVTAYGPRQIVSRRPINKLEDLKGQKIRTAGSLHNTVVKLWGAVPTFIVWSELYTAAQRGIVDAIMTATPAIQQSKVYEVCPYFFKIDGPLGNIFICVSEKSWNALSNENQRVIRRVVSEWQDVWEKKAIRELEDNALGEMCRKGQIKGVYELPFEERIKIRRLLLPEYKEYVNKKMQPKGPEVFSNILKALEIE
jgi:TRAP-type C4-dicarboxylate transport system substrate-binding protein